MVRRILVGFWVLAAALASCANPAVDGTWVADDANLLSVSGKQRLSRLLDRIHSAANAQIVIATGSAPAGTAPRAHAIQLFETWRPGSARENNGVVVFVSRDPRSIDIVTGNGMTSQLPNGDLQILLRDRIAPLLKEGKTDDALLDLAKELGAKLRGFDRRRGIPRMLFLLIAAAAGLAGFTGSFILYRTWKSAAALPPVGRARNRSYERGAKAFAGASPLTLFRAHADPVIYSPAAILAAWIGWTLFAAAMAGLLCPAADLEPSALALGAIAAFTGCLTTIGMHPPAQYGLASTLRILTVLWILGVAWGFVVSRAFGSDYVYAVAIMPGYALAVNALCGFLYRSKSLSGAIRKDRFVCSKCGHTFALLPHGSPDVARAIAPGWEEEAFREKKAEYRGWRCSCQPPTEAFLIWDSDRDWTVCKACELPSIRIREDRGVEISACAVCRAETRLVTHPAKPGKKRQSAAASLADGSTESADLPTAHEPLDTDYETDSSNDTWRSYDSFSSDSSSNDASGGEGGGSTDGSGASADW